MTNHEFSTGRIEEERRFAYWSDLVCDVFVGLDCRSPSARSFNASMRYGRLSWLRVVEAESDAIEGVRSRRRIARGQEDDLLVSLQLGGVTLLRQEDRSARLEAGDFALYDSAKPYLLEMSAQTRLLCLQFPRAQLTARLGAPTSYVAKTHCGRKGVGGVLAAFLRALPPQLTAIDACESTDLAHHALDLLALSLRRGRADRIELASSGTLALERVKRVVGAHLSDPELTPAQAAKRAGVSVRNANRLLAREGASLGRLILGERLERCRAALSDAGRDAQPIGDIAFSMGFNDSGHFSRTFRARFGISPRDYRAAQSRPKVSSKE